MKQDNQNADDLAIEASRLVILKSCRVANLRRALLVAATESFKSEEIDTHMWHLREDGQTKKQWIEDRIGEWISV